MNKVAFVFPGQGAQYVGMGLEIANKYEQASNVFKQANNELGYDIEKLCFEGPKNRLVETENTQPAVLTTSIAILKVIQNMGIKAEVTAGLSLGEYSSLVYSGVLDFKDAVKLVRNRGRYMQQAVPIGKGTMAAIIGLNKEDLYEIVLEAGNKGIVEGANYNCPGQIVISGEVDAIKYACDLSMQKGARKAVILPVSAPFHSSLLKSAGQKLKRELDNVTLNSIDCRVISNVTGNYIDNKEEIRKLLVNQVSSPVLWQQSIEMMICNEINTFIEIGPGKTLTAFIKKTARKLKRKIKCYNVENLKTLNKLAQEFN